jgi:hypothetical protein
MTYRGGARAAVIVAIMLAAAALGIGSAPRAHAQASPWCTTPQIESGENDDDALTAHIVVEGMQPVTITGDVSATNNETTCDIGVYVAPGAHAIINFADIHSAMAFGIYNNGGEVTITHSQVSDITGNGESCGGEDNTDDGGCSGGGGGMGGDDVGYTGGRHGTGILFVGAGAHGTISTSTISDFGRRGISVSGPGVSASIVDNQIIAPTSPLSWLNGVWIANGAHATITHNRISDNISPLGVGKSSSAIMIAGGPTHNGMPNDTTGIQISGNTLTDNDTGVLLSNPAVSSTGNVPPPVATSNFITGNLIRTSNPIAMNDAGIKDAGGNHDHITGNRIIGYDAQSIVITPLAVNTVEKGNFIEE